MSLTLNLNFLTSTVAQAAVACLHQGMAQQYTSFYAKIQAEQYQKKKDYFAKIAAGALAKDRDCD